MTRVSTAIVVLFLTLFSTSAFAWSEEVVDTKPFLDAYIDAVKAEHQLMMTLLTKEQSRLESLQQLRVGGHASWLETRKQQLNFDQQATACEMYGRFSRLVEDLHDVEIPGQWNRHTIGKLPFTDLMLSSERHDGESFDVDELAENYRSLVVEQTSARDKIEFELNSLVATDPWRKGYAMRLQVANSHLKASQAQARLLDQFRLMSDDDGLAGMEKFSNTLSDSNLVKSICSQCEAHVKLIEHSLQTESSRHNKLVELKNLGIGSQRDIDAVAQRRKELSTVKQMQSSVMAYLNEIAEAPAVDQIENEVFASTNDTGNPWEEIRNQFLQLEANAQYEVAKLEKAMLVEVLQRLEGAAARNLATVHGGHLSSSLATGQQTELQNYRHKIEYAELQMQLAKTRLESLKQHRISNTYVVAIDRQSADSDVQLSLRAAAIPMGSKAMLSGFLTTNGKTNSNAESKSVDAFLPHAGFGSYSSCPIRFGNLTTGYQSVQLFDNSRPLHFSSPNPLSLRSNSALSYPSRSSRKSLFPKYNYGSTYLRPRSLPTFHRPYQNGVLQPQYRQFLTPGQPPWLFPGSTSNFRTSIFRYDW